MNPERSTEILRQYLPKGTFSDIQEAIIIMAMESYAMEVGEKQYKEGQEWALKVLKSEPQLRDFEDMPYEGTNNDLPY